MRQIAFYTLHALAVSLVNGQRTVKLTLNTNPDEKLFYNKIFEIPPTEQEDYFFPSVSNLAVTSDIPVTVLRYRSNFESSRLIDRNQVAVFFKSLCDDPDDVPSKPSVNMQVGIFSNKPNLNIELNGLASENQGLLPASTFGAKYNATNYFCLGQCHAQVTEGGIFDQPLVSENQTLNSTNTTLAPANTDESHMINNTNDMLVADVVNQTLIYDNATDTVITNASDSLTFRPEDANSTGAESDVDSLIYHADQPIDNEPSNGISTSLHDMADPNVTYPKPSVSSIDVAEMSPEYEDDEIINLIQGSPMDPSFGFGTSINSHFVVVLPSMDEDIQPEVENSSTGFVQGILQSIRNRRKECQVTAEILYDSCRHSLSVTAPMLKVYDDVKTVKVDSVPFGDSCTEKCTTTETLKMSFPAEAAATINMKVEDMFIQELDESMCYTAMEGRPFTNSEGKPISSIAVISDTSEWGLSSHGEPTLLSSDAKYQNSDNIIDYKTLGDDWTDRALGEHASIASFAAFTIDLMTNGAPPDLIRDSLKAALDELNHATTSFEMASLLTGLQLDPGPFPESKVNFKKDTESLALGVVKEGCVDETVSALLAAYQVDLDSHETDSIKQLLREKTRTIATEEATHSALAWRTVHWLCTTDEENACSIAKSYLYDQAHKRVASRIKGNRNVEEELTRLFNTLIPLVVINETQNDPTYPEEIIRSLRSQDSNISFLQEVVNLIIEGVKKEIR